MYREQAFSVLDTFRWKNRNTRTDKSYKKYT